MMKIAAICQDAPQPGRKFYELPPLGRLPERTRRAPDRGGRWRGTVLARPSDSDSLIGFRRETRCLFIAQHTVIAQPLLSSCCERRGRNNDGCGMQGGGEEGARLKI